jgi:predicted metal-binding membrane protein
MGHRRSIEPHSQGGPGCPQRSADGCPQRLKIKTASRSYRPSLPVSIIQIVGPAHRNGAIKLRVELLSWLIRHRRVIVAGALAAVSTAAWAYLLVGAGIDMEAMVKGDGQMMTLLREWSLPYAVLIFVMWGAMMVAMMLPTAAPTVLLVTALAWDRTANPNFIPALAMLFALGYLLVWCGFSFAATLTQWGLDKAGLLSETMALGSAILANAALIAAGIYQWTPLKDTCLRHCRSPSEFLIRHWREDTIGAVQTGVRHGLFCLGCCWMLMALLLVGGLMNLAWVGAIAVLVLDHMSA